MLRPAGKCFVGWWLLVVVASGCGRLVTTAPEIPTSTQIEWPVSAENDRRLPLSLNPDALGVEGTAPIVGLLARRILPGDTTLVLIANNGTMTRLAAINGWSSATWVSGTPWILFDTGTPRSVWGIRSDGTQATRVFPGSDSTGYWSPSWGRSVCAVYAVNGYPANVYLRGRGYDLGPNGGVLQARVSTDERFILARSATSAGLFQIETSSGRVTRVSETATMGDFSILTGSVVASEERPNGAAWISLDGRALTHGNVRDTHPGYSPDGRALFFSRSRRGQPSQLMVMDPTVRPAKPEPAVAIGDRASYEFLDAEIEITSP